MPFRSVLKKAMKKGGNDPKAQPPRMTPDEKRLVRDMAHERRMSPSQIAKAIGRNLSSVCRLLAQKLPTKMGRPQCLKPAQVDRLVKLVDGMVKDADAEYEVTLPMIHRRSRFKCSERTISRALHAKGYRFSPCMRK